MLNVCDSICNFGGSIFYSILCPLFILHTAGATLTLRGYDVKILPCFNHYVKSQIVETIENPVSLALVNHILELMISAVKLKRKLSI